MIRKTISKHSSKNWRANSISVTVCSIVFLMLQSCVNMPAYHSLDDPFTARQWYEQKHGLNKKPINSHTNHAESPNSQSAPAVKSEQVIQTGHTPQYTVQKNDTLFSIAYRFEVDYRKLASANDIESPFTIFPGQILDITSAQSIDDSQVNLDITVINLPSSFIPPKENIPETKVEEIQTPSLPQSAPASKNAPNENTVSQKPVTKPTPSKATKNSASGWFWPSKGTIVRTFSASGDISKGIDIKGRKGESVRVAATGTVVFVGTGPLGYGQLLIVQHDNQWLSAYSNLDKIVVKEKQIVKASEVIAEIGNDRSGNSILHFEIRRLGKPVDPILYLPKRE